MPNTWALKGKSIAVTGAGGTLGRALIKQLASQGAAPIALTRSADAEIEGAAAILPWQTGQELALQACLQTVDILVINHGLNVYGERMPAAIEQSLEVNALSVWRLMEVFLTTVQTDPAAVAKEIWVNTSEAEVSPAFSPLYEISKRLIGDLINLRRLDSPCVIRKLVLGPFKSNLNPIGVMSADWVAWAIVRLARGNRRTIIVTINPLTYVVFPLKEMVQSLYFKLFSSSGTQG